MHFWLFMEKLAKIDYDNQKNLRFFVNQYKKAQEMIKETEAFYLSFLISKTSTTLDVLNNNHIKWLDTKIELNRSVIDNCINGDTLGYKLCSENLEEFLNQQKQKINKYKEEGGFNGASIIIHSPLVDAVISQIKSIKNEYEHLNEKLTRYAVSCGKHPYFIKNYMEDNFRDILDYYLVDRYHYNRKEEDGDDIKPLFKKIKEFAIYYNHIGCEEEHYTHMVYDPSYDEILGEDDAFISSDDKKIIEKNYWSDKSKSIRKNIPIIREECYAWMLQKVRSEKDIKKKYPLVYEYYLNKYENQLKTIDNFKKKFKFLFDNDIFERFQKLQKECITSVLLKDFLKDNIEYIPFQGFEYCVSSVGWEEHGNHQIVKIEDGRLETWLKLYKTKDSKIPNDARPGSWSPNNTPRKLESFKTSKNPKKKFSDYGDGYYETCIRSRRDNTKTNGEWLEDAIDKKKVYKYVEESWKELIDMCKHIIISSADKNGKLSYSIPIKSAQFHYVLSNINSRVIISNNADTVYYVGSNEKDLSKYKIKYDDKHDQVICSRKDVEEHKKYAWPSDAPTIRTTYELEVIFDCSTGNLIKIVGNSDSDEISCKHRY